MIKGCSGQVVACYRFMRLFGVSLFSVIQVSDKSIDAIVAWPEDCRRGIPDVEDAQEIRWIFDSSDQLDDALLVGEYAYDAGWICSDTISFRKTELQRRLKWDARRLDRALRKLLSLKVNMIDEGAETDFFYLHMK